MTSLPLVWSHVEQGYVVRLQFRTRSTQPFWSTLVVDTGSQDLLLKNNRCMWENRPCQCLDDVCGVSGGSEGRVLRAGHWGSQHAKGYTEDVEWLMGDRWIPCRALVAEEMEGVTNSQLLGLAPGATFLQCGGFTRFELNLQDRPSLLFGQPRAAHSVSLGRSGSRSHYLMPVVSVRVDAAELSGIHFALLDAGTAVVLVSRRHFPWMFETLQHNLQVNFGNVTISSGNHVQVGDLDAYYPEFGTSTVLLGVDFMAGWTWTFEGSVVWVGK